MATAALAILMLAFPVIDTMIGTSAAITAIVPAVVITLIATRIAIAPPGPIGSIVLGVIAVIEIGVVAEAAAGIARILVIIIGRPSIAIAVIGIGDRGQQQS